MHRLIFITSARCASVGTDYLPFSVWHRLPYCLRLLLLPYCLRLLLSLPPPTREPLRFQSFSAKSPLIFSKFKTKPVRLEKLLTMSNPIKKHFKIYIQ
ncbi:hypothetical protein MmiAt1_10750 [Methanimicrococcus sp. At1]|uniref:Uncharacterized protein n=1 Tax=Methanimicrococcus hacksteinii TaxID=3028293 RepID=A0ABU3VQ04_9EURY|nr:hypothetical protein [Methanimicrococcus sp. At1]